MLKYASRTINYKASVPVSRAGAQVMDLADKVLRLLLDLQFFAQQHFPSDLYNTWKKVYPAASQAAIQLYNAAKATSEGREYVYPNLNGELLRARPQEMAVFDHALNALGTPHLISYPAAITMGNGPADPRSASPDSTASAVAWGFGNSFLDWLDNGLPESLKGGMTKVVTLLGTAVPAAATLGYLLEMGTVGTAVGIGAMGVVLPVAVTAASMVAVGCVLNNISDGYGQQWVPGLNWLSDLYSGLDLSSIPRRLIGALDGLGNNIAEVLSSGELASMGRTAASHAAAGVWEPWCGACTSCISCTAACTTCTSCTSTCTGCTGCTASCISCTNCTSCTSSCTYCTGGCTQCTSNGDTVR